MPPSKRHPKALVIAAVLIGILLIVFSIPISGFLQAPRINGMHYTGVSQSLLCIETCTPTTYHYEATGTEKAILDKITDHFQKQGYTMGNYRNEVNPSGYYCSTDTLSSYDIYGYYKQDGSYDHYPPTIDVTFDDIPNPSSGSTELGCGRPAANYKIRIRLEAGH
jgi:hypothetical protein